MYPKIIQSIFDRGERCKSCNSNLSTSGIALIGVRPPDPWRNRPLGLYLTVCPLCGHRTETSFDVTLADLIAAVEAKWSEFESAPPLESMPFMIPQKDVPPVETEQTSEEPPKPKPVRPSRRSNQPLKPPTPAEIKRFLARLKATSFKTNSKGFKKLTGPPSSKPLDDNDIKGPGEDD